MPKTKKLRTILTPGIVTDLAGTDEKLVYWKQILPKDTIQYTDKTGETRLINFDDSYHRDCIEAFRRKAIDQTCFQIADPRNSHGRDFDPERQRAVVTDMATYDELPPDVKAKVGKPGLYAKMRFFDKNAAKAVRANPDLGVSARVRENFTRADGTFVKRAVIHVLGTIDPRVTGMSGWQASDFGYSAEEGNVLDLSNGTYEGAQMPKKKQQGNVATIPTDDEIEAMTDEELDAFLAAGQAELDAENGGGGDGDDDENADDDDDSDDNTPGPDEVNPDGTRRTANDNAEASLSNAARRAIDLANTQAAEAHRRATAALAKQADAEFKAYRTTLIGQGVPPDEIDLCEPILNRHDGMVVDLSNDGGEDVDVAEIVRSLLEARKGTIDMSHELGHGGSFDMSEGGTDPDKDMLEAWSNEYGD